MTNSLGTSIAAEFKRLFGDVAKFSNGNMFVCIDGRWKVDEYNVYITKLLIKFNHIILADLSIVSDMIYQDAEWEEREGKKTIPTPKMHVLSDTLKKIQNGLSSALTDLFRSELFDENFYKCVDADTDLIGFNNGIFNLKTNEFMPYSKEYVITQSTGYDFDSSNFELTDYVVKFLREIFPDNELHEYMLTTLASCLDGKNKEETLSFWTGISSKQTGSNGKSTLCNLLAFAFGDYFLNGHPSIITGKIEKAQSANPAVFELKNKRIVIFQEIETEGEDNATKVNMAKLKSYSGNDISISARTLYKKQEAFKPTFQPIICLNKLPKLSTVDGGTDRRVKNISFESKFVDNADDEKWSKIKHVFEIHDRNLKQRMQPMGPALMRILLNQYQVYRKNGVFVPNKVTVASSEYIKQHNEDINYLIDTVIRPKLTFTDNKRDFVQFVFIKKWMQDHHVGSFSSTALYDALEESFSDNYNPRYRDVNKKDFNKCLQCCVFNTSESFFS